ncbi:MAG: M48 family metalloprotease [Syntrophaceae bacterium]|nr:M48 family metalloprotease [Syntrophaceae bacterium]NTW76663.1 M48 family metalloprotease [Syntrophaceae bacterium]
MKKTILKKTGFILYPVITLAALSLMMLQGCEVVKTAAKVGEATGVLTSQQAAGIERTATAVEISQEEITPSQEYYIGRTVGAVITNKYKVYQNDRATMYVNELGQTIAMSSDLPETFGGYHFLILDTDEINAFAAPGGLIFISRGLLRCCRNEDAAAAVLAHEIGHVQYRHGLDAIEKSRITNAVTTGLLEAGKNLTNAQVAELTTIFEGSIQDITSTLINSGYSRSFEMQADQAAVAILKRSGYNPQGLVDMLRMMDTKLKPGGMDFAKTHPSPETRIEAIKDTFGAFSPVNERLKRQERFKRALAGI